MRSGIFERSVGELIVANESAPEGDLEKLLNTSVQVEGLQRKKPASFFID